MKAVRPALKWYGGKYYLAKRIVELIPPHLVYCEPCAGGLSVLLNKQKSHTEIASDIHPHLIEFYRVLRDNCGELMEVLLPLDYNENVFDMRHLFMGSNDPIVRAAGFIVSNRFSYGGLGGWFSWSDGNNSGGKQKFNETWESVKRMLPDISSRISKVIFDNESMPDIVSKINHKDTFIYYDPPYLHDTRNGKKAYEYEMSDMKHMSFLHFLTSISCKIMISGYRNEIYDSILCSWNTHEFNVSCSTYYRKRTRRNEVLWMNF